MEINTIGDGVYLVIDPSLEKSVLLSKLRLSLEGGLSAVQVWNHWPHQMDRKEKSFLIDRILDLTRPYKIPVFMNDEWFFLKDTGIHGVHFDTIPDNFEEIKHSVARPFLKGITVGNDSETIKWAGKNDFTYISFCSMFPSSSVTSCDIIDLETVKNARDVSNLPIYLSGGITLKNIHLFNGLMFNGIAVISGILNVEDPKKATTDYRKELFRISNPGKKPS